MKNLEKTWSVHLNNFIKNFEYTFVYSYVLVNVQISWKYFF